MRKLIFIISPPIANVRPKCHSRGRSRASSGTQVPPEQILAARMTFQPGPACRWLLLPVDERNCSPVPCPSATIHSDEESLKATGDLTINDKSLSSLLMTVSFSASPLYCISGEKWNSVSRTGCGWTSCTILAVAETVPLAVAGWLRPLGI